MTTIEWTDESWNPLRGCTRISPGCQNCYAERMAARFSGPGMPFEGLARMTEHGPRWTGEIRLLPEELDKPLHWKKPRRVFVNSMSDLFHEKVPFEFVDRVLAVMALTPHHTYQVLTKRPERMLEYLSSPPAVIVDRIVKAVALGFPIGTESRLWPVRWPLPNLWVGTSVENQEYADKRIPHLLQVPAAVRFLSCEPLLGRVDLTAVRHRGVLENVAPGVSLPFDVTIDALEGTFFDGWDSGTANGRIHWVIVGAESGPGARSMDEDWVRFLRDQCTATDVAFFYKQRLDEKGHKVALPDLDGRTWTEMPNQTKEAVSNG